MELNGINYEQPGKPLAVVCIDGHSIGNGKPGPITKQLRQLYQERVLSEASGL